MLERNSCDNCMNGIGTCNLSKYELYWKDDKDEQILNMVERMASEKEMYGFCYNHEREEEDEC